MVSDSEVSVVIQGPIAGRPSDAPEKQLTRRAAASVRAVWPRSEIILSTWAGADITGIDCDQLIFNEDPGAIPINEGPQSHILNNLNRQLVSTRNGLARAQRPYAVKLRTDTLLEKAVDFSALDALPRAPEWSLLKKRVIALTVFTRHSFRRPLLFHLSDLFQAGLTEDLVTIWSAPNVVEPAHTRAIDPHNRPAVDAFPEWEMLLRCASEQYLAEQLARRKYPDLYLRHYSDGSTRELFIWLRLLANDFLLLHPAAAGVSLPRRLGEHDGEWDLFRSSAEEWPWLGCWAKQEVSWFQRMYCAALFRRQQWTYTAPSVRRAFHRAWLKIAVAGLASLTPSAPSGNN